MPEFFISNRASVASEKNFERMRGKSYRPMEMEKFNKNRLQKKNSCTPWSRAYFTNGPNAAASIAPTLIRHCVLSRWLVESAYLAALYGQRHNFCVTFKTPVPIAFNCVSVLNILL